VTWKLLWQHNRYLDGTIPAEEACNFANEEPPPDFTRRVGEELIDEKPRDERVVAHSGEPARYAGTWAAVGDLSGRIFWKQGDALPRLKDREVEWVYQASGTSTPRHLSGPRPALPPAPRSGLAGAHQKLSFIPMNPACCDAVALLRS
jgi:hypothetical protein